MKTTGHQSVPVETPNGGLQIFQTVYSSKLVSLYRDVLQRYKLPIRVTAAGVGENAELFFSASEIVVHARPNDGEDTFASMLMRAVLQNEGFPRLVMNGLDPVSHHLTRWAGSSIDHVVVNNRLRKLGYDPLTGFIKRADGYENLLATANIDGDHQQRAIQMVLVLHQMIKYVIYFERANAEQDFLIKFPQVEAFWRELKLALVQFQRNDTASGAWDAVVRLENIYRKICEGTGAPPDFLHRFGYTPIRMPTEMINSPAFIVFATVQKRFHQRVITEVSLRVPHILCAFVDVPELPHAVVGLPADEFMRTLRIDHILD